jgi:hypothetical protein
MYGPAKACRPCLSAHVRQLCRPHVFGLFPTPPTAQRKRVLLASIQRTSECFLRYVIDR